MDHNFLLSGSAVDWRPIAQGPGTSSAPITAERGAQPYRLAKWRAEPGTYERPQGMPWSEVFVVYAGSGRLRYAEGVVDLVPGVVIDVRKGVPYVLEIDRALEKLGIITL
ncbi:MAG: hypothetical protein IT515_00450 [Burkholderiales bacterium]|nr:hypothetical protein [Burkholderiales bacterium]